MYLSKDYILKDFIVHSGVLRPEKMSALSLAQWLFSHNPLYKNKVVLDMGCGTGIQGITMAKRGCQKNHFFRHLSKSYKKYKRKY